MTDSQKAFIYRFLFITVLLLAVFGNTLNHGFVWDDQEIIVNNPIIQKLGNIPRFFLMEDIATGPTGFYRPVTYVSFALDRALWGLNPVGFNITNLALHIAAVMLFYRAVNALFRDDRLALYSALIFSLHPIVGESVNFHAGGRNTLLCACFALASLHAYVNEKRIRSILFFTLAIFSKEFGLLLPALFLIHDTVSGKGSKKKTWIGYFPFLAAIAIYLILRSLSVVQGNLLKTINIAENFWIVPQTIMSYLKLMIAPIDLKTLYDVNNQITWISFITYSLLLLALIAAAVVFRKKTEIMFGIAIFLLFMLPVTNLFPLGTAMMADRYAYFSLFGFSLVLAYGISRLQTQVGIVVMVLLCALYISIDVRRNGYWKDEVTLFTQMTKDAPEVFVGYMNLGSTYFKLHDYVNAEKYLTAIPGKKDLTGEFLLEAGRALWEMGRLEKAISLLDQAIAMDRDSYLAYLLAGAVHDEMGHPDLARSYREKAKSLTPRLSEAAHQKAISAHHNGQTRMAEGLNDKAEVLFNKALSNAPFFAPAIIDLGILSARKGDTTSAMRYFRRAAVLDPHNPTIYDNLSRAYDALGRKAEADTARARFNELSTSPAPPAH
ncbi:MAG: tetratricopeptide repeat protein [Desulfuromonadales bacterium]|nr:tetratricopeptide repeat protein [Desulfuromonadales bacterium]